MKPILHTPSTLNQGLMKRLRAHFEMSQADLAYLSTVSLATISKLESGILQNPRLQTLNAIAKAFNVNTSQLLSTETPEPGNFKLAHTLKSECK